MSDQPTLNIFGLGDAAVARTTDPETSHEAALSVSREAIRITQRRVLLVLLKYGPQTDEEIARQPDVGSVHSPSGLRTRRHELVERGLVVWTGEKRKMLTRRSGRVWALTPDGEALAKALR